jgi:hypothetical protein
MRLLHPGAPWIGDREVVPDEVVLAVTRDELVALAGAVNESIEAVEGWEFHTRLGVTRDEARALGLRIGEVLRQTSRPE